MHAETRIGDSVVMLCDEMPDTRVNSPKTYGGSPVGFCVYVENVDARAHQLPANETGRRVVLSPADWFGRPPVSVAPRSER